MYNQKEYIYSEFTKNYKNIKEPMAIYGIGVDAGNLLAMIPEYNIVGLLDGIKKMGEVHGKKVIDLFDLLELRVKTIVIVARPAVLPIIYHRIEEFVKKNNIFVGDVRGRNLRDLYGTNEYDIDYYQKNWADLKKTVDEHEVISFDIFDTLLVRKTFLPRDIFDIVEKRLAQREDCIEDYARQRILAEDRCYKRGINPTIYEIYEELQKSSGCSDAVIQRYLNEEINVEKEFLIPRKSMLDYFNSIKDTKKIYLISDMYLPSATLEEILSSCGYTGYLKIYVSCEHGCGKLDGLFETFLREQQVKERVLHIGDNVISDIESAKQAGFDTFLVMNKVELLENSTYGKIIDKSNSLFEHIITGLFCNRAFDDPFILYNTKGKHTIGNCRDLAYLFVAPTIACYAAWLINNVLLQECDFVFYPSRDAYMLQKICEKIISLQNLSTFPNGKYLYTSRRAMNGVTAFNLRDIKITVSQEYHEGICDMFHDRFNYDIKEENLPYSKELALKHAQTYYEDIVKCSGVERKNYLNYLKCLGYPTEGKLAFIDFVAAGTIQNGLTKIIDNEIQGFYFLKRNTDNEELEKHIQVLSFYQPKGDFELEANIYQFYLFFELLLTSPEPTFNHINSEGEVVFFPENRSKDEIELVMEMQEEIIAFSKELYSLYPCIKGEVITPYLADCMVGFIGKEYSDIRCEKVVDMKLTDEYLAKTFNIFDR